MASMCLPKPGKVVDGEEIGPCVEPCQHKDCALTRAMAAAICPKCGKPIGYETPFVQDCAGRDVGDMGLCHERCAATAH